MAVIGIMSAMHEELAAVLAQWPGERRVSVAGRDFWIGQWHGHAVVAVLSRIGKVAAATTATVLLERFQAQALVFTGVAGGLGADVQVGDVVVAKDFVQHDMDASPLFPRHEVPLYGLARFEAHAGLAAQLLAASQQALGPGLAKRHGGWQTSSPWPMASPQVHQGLVLSGDCFVATRTQSQSLRSAWPDALAVEMEGAAVAQVCHDYQVPFAAVRTISDRADDTAAQDFKRFIQEVAGPYSLAILSQWLQNRPPGQTDFI